MGTISNQVHNSQIDLSVSEQNQGNLKLMGVDKKGFCTHLQRDSTKKPEHCAQYCSNPNDVVKISYRISKFIKRHS